MGGTQDRFKTDYFIKEFLEGNTKDDKYKYITHVETYWDSNKVTVFRELPGGKKERYDDYFLPFVYMKKNAVDRSKLKLSKDEIDSLKRRYGIEITVLETGNQQRLIDGYRYMVTSTVSVNAIAEFFKQLRTTIFRNNNFLTIRPNEQFLIQKKTRLFKGMEDYDDLHKLIFDIETTGLDPLINRVFLIGIRDNRGFETLLSAKELDNDEYEKELIYSFWATIRRVEPSMIAGYNSENFDFYFILKRMEILGIPINSVQTTRDDENQYSIVRKPATIKLGGETEDYEKTIMWGYDVLDIMHSVRKAKAIDSSIKKTGLKYIVKHQRVNKPDRMYIEDGKDIYRFWKDNPHFVINTSDNKYVKVPKEFQGDPDRYLASEEVKDIFKTSKNPQLKLTSGREITQRYLQDDLWETQKVDELFNQAIFMKNQWVPCAFDRSATMGDSALWNLILISFSFENGLAIPDKITKRDFVGGLSRVFLVGFSKRILKLDFSSLYPSIELTHKINPDCDIHNIILRILDYTLRTRGYYKTLSNDKKISPEDRGKYKVLQLPLKIMNNSNFGFLGSEFGYWADMDCAEEITCRGRQYLRLLAHFCIQYGLTPLICDTDGINFVVPDKTSVDIDLTPLKTPIPFDDICYMDKDGNKLYGTEAVVQKFNDEKMKGDYMGVDNDGEWVSCINVSKKNYANLEEDGSIKYTGNTIKSSTLPEYIEKFLDKGMKMILHEKPVDFVNYYYEYLEKLTTFQIPLKEIASKARVKKTMMEYLKRGAASNGNLLSRQAHMELILAKTLPEQLYKDITYWLDLHYDLNGPKIGNFMKIIDSSTQEAFDKEFRKKNENWTKLIVDISEHEGLPISVHVKGIPPSLKQKEIPTDKIKRDNLIENGFYVVNEVVVNMAKDMAKSMHDKLLDEISKYKFPMDLGDTFYYVNNGTTKSHGDTKLDKDGKLMSTLLDSDELERYPDTKGTYNVAKYVDAFNKRVEKLLVVFHPDIRDTIIKNVKNVVNKLTKEIEFVLPEKEVFTEEQLKLYVEEKDTLEELFTMSDKEVKFWNKTKLDPREIFPYFRSEEPLWYELEAEKKWDKYKLPKANVEPLPVHMEESAETEEVSTVSTIGPKRVFGNKEKTVEEGVLVVTEEVDHTYEVTLNRLNEILNDSGVTVYRTVSDVPTYINSMVLKKEDNGEFYLYEVMNTNSLRFMKKINPIK